jgi:NtrC-family two-component system sensor histidine kinase KinB
MGATLDGNPRRLLPRALPIGGARAGAVLVFYDVTELAKLDELRLEFVGTASHELRTPLTTLRMMLALLAERAEHLNASEREMLATALLGCEQLSATVEAFLDITRAETSELLLARESLAIDELVRDAERLFRPRCEEAGVELSLALHGPARVDGDRARLRAVLSNLLGNALKYTPAGGAIAICADATPNGSLALTISDTGAGVPEEYRTRIFERYFRVEHQEPTRARGHGAGAGIGLYLSRKIVEAHGGSIRCNTGQRGHGTRMVVELPLHTP